MELLLDVRFLLEFVEGILKFDKFLNFGSDVLMENSGPRIVHYFFLFGNHAQTGILESKDNINDYI